MKHLALGLIVLTGAVTVGCSKADDSAAPAVTTGAVPTANTPPAPTEDPTKGDRDASGMPIPGSPDSK